MHWALGIVLCAMCLVFNVASLKNFDVYLKLTTYFARHKALCTKH